MPRRKPRVQALWSITELAAKCGMHRDSMRRSLAANGVPTVLVGKRKRAISTESLMVYAPHIYKAIIAAEALERAAS